MPTPEAVSTDIPSRFGRRWLVQVACFLGVGAPFLMGYGVIPQTNLTAEALGVVGVALMLVLLAQRLGGENLRNVPVRPLVAALSAVAMLLVVVVCQMLVFGINNLDAYLIYLGYLVVAIVAVVAGHLAARDCTEASIWLRAMAVALVVAALLGALASVAQYLHLDASWAMVSPVADAGRTYGFVRQPNQQAALLNLGLLSSVVLVRMRVLRWPIALVGAVLLTFAMVTTGSRTGLIQLVCVAALCGLANPVQLRFRGRLSLAAGLVLLGAVLWAGLYLASTQGLGEFYGARKLEQTSTEGLGVRLALWRETWSMVLAQPWLGQGAMHFPSLFFLGGHASSTGTLMANAHNLVLQMAFDFGLPATLLALGLLVWVVWSGREAMGEPAGFLALGSVGLVMVHSMLEFPLWYTYFVVITGFWLGWLTVRDTAVASREAVSVGYRRVLRLGLVLVGVSLMLVTASINKDFFRLTPIYTPHQQSQLAGRIEDAQGVFWFHRFAAFPRLVHTKVTSQNSHQVLAEAAELGCQMTEAWFLPNTVVALADQGRLDDAKSIIFQFTQLKGATGSLKKVIQDSDIRNKDVLLSYLNSPTPVPPSYGLYLEACMGAKVKS